MIEKKDINLDEIPESGQSWIGSQLMTDETLVREKVEEWYLGHVKEYVTLGLCATMPTIEAFYGAVEAATLGDIQSEFTAPPTEVDLMIIGHYPTRQAGSSVLTEMVCYGSDTGNTREKAKLTLWNDFTKLKGDYVPLTSIKTDVTYYPDGKQEGMFEFTAQKATDLSIKNKTDWISPDRDARLEVLRGDAPHIPLNDIQNVPSRHLPSKDGKANYPDTLDLRRIIVNIIDYKSGVGKTGHKWAMYQVVDGTFQISLKNKSFTVWVDSGIAEAAGAGPGSFVEMIGYTQADKDGRMQMTACFVNPIILKPMAVESDVQKDTPAAPAQNTPGGVQTNVPSVPAMNVVTHGDGA